MIEFQHISKSYHGQSIINDLNFTIQDGEFIVLIGPSGCGKTTTLKMINRLISMNEGKILLDGEDITKKDLKSWKKRAKKKKKRKKVKKEIKEKTEQQTNRIKNSDNPYNAI